MDKTYYDIQDKPILIGSGGSNVLIQILNSDMNLICTSSEALKIALNIMVEVANVKVACKAKNFKSLTDEELKLAIDEINKIIDEVCEEESKK